MVERIHLLKKGSVRGPEDVVQNAICQRLVSVVAKRVFVGFGALESEQPQVVLQYGAQAQFAKLVKESQRRARWYAKEKICNGGPDRRFARFIRPDDEMKVLLRTLKLQLLTSEFAVSDKVERLQPHTCSPSAR
jgi:hypothetical protein